MSKLPVAGGGGQGGGGGILPVPGTKFVKLPVRVIQTGDYQYNFRVKLETDGLPVPEAGDNPTWPIRLNALVILRAVTSSKYVNEKFIGVGIGKTNGRPGNYATIDTACGVSSRLGARMDNWALSEVYCSYDNTTQEIDVNGSSGFSDIVDAYLIMEE